jgi:hypothetical protein
MGVAEGLFAGGDGSGVVVGLLAAAEDDVGIGIAGGGEDGGEAVFGDAEEVVGAHGGAHAVDGGVEGAVGAVLEADGGGDAAGDFAVGLGFGGARADDVPGDKVADVLGHEDVEEFGAGWAAEFGDANRKCGHADAFLDVEGVVH